MELGVKLRTLAKIRRCSQVELAAALSVSQSQVSKWMRGKNTPDIFQAFKLAQKLGVSLDFLADTAAEDPIPALKEMELLGQVRGLLGGAAEAMHRIMNYQSPAPQEWSGEDNSTQPSERTQGA